MVRRITVTLESSEYGGLLELALKELRNPPDQLRMILRRELERLGMIPVDGCHDDLDWASTSREVGS